MSDPHHHPDFTSRRYQPDPEKCCERCVFGRGQHAEFCQHIEAVKIKKWATKGIPIKRKPSKRKSGGDGVGLR